MKLYDCIVIGGGPVGLYAASLLNKHNIAHLLLEANQLGGQCLSLYPEKEVVDVPKLGIMKSKDLVNSLISKCDKTCLLQGMKVKEIKPSKGKFIITTEETKFLSKTIILATGLGFHSPRKMGLIGEDRCSNILYYLKDYESLKGKNVVIFGGGDSALDWAKELSEISNVTLVHRRMEFRGNPATIEGKRVALCLPYIPFALTCMNGKATSIVISNVQTSEKKELPCDYILVNYGQVPTPSTFGYPLTEKGFGLEAGNHFEISPHLFAVGDCVYSSSHQKRMEPGFEECEEVISRIISQLS